MARHRKYQTDEEANPGLDISSLIDVCFLLLIYFLVATTIQKKEVDVPLALPAAAPSDSVPEIEPLFIKVDANGSIYVGAGASQELLDTDVNSRSLPLLSQRLNDYSVGANSGGKKALVQMWVDGGANQQRVIDVLNALVGAGISSVTFTDLVD